MLRNLRKWFSVLMAVVVFSGSLSCLQTAAMPLPADPDFVPEGYTDDSNAGMLGLFEKFKERPDGMEFAPPSGGAVKTAEVAFLLDTSGSMLEDIAKVKESVTDFSLYLESHGINLRMAVVEYGADYKDGAAFVHKINFSSWHTSTEQLIQTISGFKASGDRERLTDAIGALLKEDPETGVPNIYWSSDAYKFVFCLTDEYDSSANDYPSGNRYGYANLAAAIPDLQAANIPVTVITLKSLFSDYKKLTEQTGGALFDIDDSDYAQLMKDFADSILGASQRKKKAIYVLPGYLGSEIYAGADGSGDRLWLNRSDSWPHMPVLDKNSTAFNQNADGSPTNRSNINSKRDAYGANSTYKDLVERLKADFADEYDIVFFPYNWLADLNDSVKTLEGSTGKYSDVVFVTHSTGGLLAAAYLAKSENNRKKVKKAILIAAPLLGTYASLFPIERGDSGKLFSVLTKENLGLDMAANNNWVKAWAKNSPTSYQLLPGEEYLEHYPLWDLKGLFDGSDKNITSAAAFYDVLNKSSNINKNLTNGNGRSHAYFRETALSGDISSDFYIGGLNALLLTDTFLIGTESGFNTPSVAKYEGGQAKKLKDIDYNKKGDGTVQGISAKGELRGFGGFLNGQFGFKLRHTDLVSDSAVLALVSRQVSGLASSSPALSDSVSDGAGMSDMLKIRVSSTNRAIDTKIYDASGAPVASAKGDTYSGFGEDGFIYDNFADSASSTLASIYIPNKGYKVVFSYGTSASNNINFEYQVSTLAPDGYKTALGGTSFDNAGTGGVIATFDATGEAVTADNLADKFTEFDEFTQFKTDWDIQPVLSMTLGGTLQAPITGADAFSAALSLTYNTSNDTVVTVTPDGLLTAVGYGRATVAVTDGNKSSVCVITVPSVVTGMTLPDINMVIGERKFIQPQFSPPSAAGVKVSYTPSVPGIVQISEYGVILGLSEGATTVTGRTADGVTSSFTVNVADGTVFPVKSIALSAFSASFMKNTTFRLNISAITPENATNKDVKWFVGDSGVLETVSFTEDAIELKGLKRGKTYVTAVSVDGGYTSTCVISVEDSVMPYPAAKNGVETPGKIILKNVGSQDKYQIAPKAAALAPKWKTLKGGSADKPTVVSVAVKPGDKLYLQSEIQGSTIPEIPLEFKAKAPGVKVKISKPNALGSVNMEFYMGSDKVDLSYLQYKIGESGAWKTIPTNAANIYKKGRVAGKRVSNALNLSDYAEKEQIYLVYNGGGYTWRPSADAAGNPVALDKDKSVKKSVKLPKY